MEEFKVILDFIKTAGLPGAVIAAAFAWHRGWWVGKREYDNACKDRDEWRTIALGYMHAGETILRTVESKPRGRKPKPEPQEEAP